MSISIQQFTKCNKRDLSHPALLSNARKTQWLSQILKEFGFQKTGESNTIIMVLTNQQSMELWPKEDLSLLALPLNARRMVINSTTKVMLLQTTTERPFQKTGVNNTSTGVSMLIQQSIDFINIDLFQLITVIKER